MVGSGKERELIEVSRFEYSRVSEECASSIFRVIFFLRLLKPWHF
jgi:hypothetical protein